VSSFGIDQRRVDVSRTRSKMSLATNFVRPSVGPSVGRSVCSVGFLSGYGSYVITTEHLHPDKKTYCGSYVAS